MEISILNWIQQMRTPFLDQFMVMITRLGDVGYVWIFLTLILILIPKTRRIGVTLAIALIINAFLCNLILKPLIGRERPFTLSNQIALLITQPQDYSFPSGHTSASYAVIGALMFSGWKKSGWFALVIGTLIAFSRMYLYVHYPTDIIGGIVLGLSCGYIGYRIVNLRK